MCFFFPRKSVVCVVLFVSASRAVVAGLLSSFCVYCFAETCPPGWQKGYNDTVCLTLVTNSSVWSDSENACKAQGGQLASLNTLDEFYYVQAICGAGTLDGCWVGGQEVSSTSSNILTAE